MPTAQQTRLPSSYRPPGVSSTVPGPRSSREQLRGNLRSQDAWRIQNSTRGRPQPSHRPIPSAPRYGVGNAASNPGTAIVGQPLQSLQGPNYIPPNRYDPALPYSSRPGYGQAARPLPNPPRGVPGAPGRPSFAGGSAAAGAVAGIGGTISAGVVLASGGSVPEAIGAGVGSALGSAGGFAAGGAIGAALGGPVGAAIGAQAGAFVGGAFGSWAGQALGDMLDADSELPPGAAAGFGPHGSAGATDDFGGYGQRDGVFYEIFSQDERQRPAGGRSPLGVLAGPITSFSWIKIRDAPTSAFPDQIEASVSASNAAGAVISDNTFGIPPFTPLIERADGQEETPISGPASPRPAGALASDPPPAPGRSGGVPGPFEEPNPPPPIYNPQPAPPAPAPAGPASAPTPAGEPAPSALPGSGPVPGEAPAPAPAPKSAPAQLGSGAHAAALPRAWAIEFVKPIPEGSLDPGASTDPDIWENPALLVPKAPQIPEVPQPTPPTIPEVPLPQAPQIPVVPLPAPAGALQPIPRANSGVPTGTALTPRLPVTSAPNNQIATRPPAPTQYPARVGNPCGCNAPLVSGQQQINRRLDDVLGAGAGGAGAGQAASLAAILAKLNQMQQFAETAWRATKMDKVLNMLTLITVLHNASMLSREVSETLSQAISNGLSVIGIRDENDSPIDVQQVINNSVEDFFINILGEDVYNGIRENWNKLNNILRSASIIIWTVRSIFDGTQEVVEWIGENTGKIGNALKRWGVVGEKAYPWMATRLRPQDKVSRKYRRILDGLEQAEDSASSFAMVTGEVREIQEEINELGEQRDQFTASVRDFAPGAWPDNSNIPTDAENREQNSVSADVGAGDMEPGDSLQ